MKKSILFFTFVIMFAYVDAQELYRSYNQYTETVNEEYNASAKLLKDAESRIPCKDDLYIYQDINGFITIGDHDRVTVTIYDKEEQWYETHIYMLYCVPKWGRSKREMQSEYIKISKAFNKVIKDKGYDVEEEMYFSKFINKKGTWYESHEFMTSEAGYYRIILDEAGKLVEFKDRGE